MTQLDLMNYIRIPASSDAPAIKPSKPARPSIESRFSAFHAANPHVFAEALRIAREWLARGDRYISVKAIFETMRTSVVTVSDGYRLNNDYTQIVGRLLIKEEPRLVDVIRLRKVKQ
jgi:hypothetical protein